MAALYNWGPAVPKPLRRENEKTGRRALPGDDREMQIMPEDDAGLPAALRDVDRILEEMIVQQRGKVLRVAREFAPQATPEDIMNPHDIPELARAPVFHFEDGILSGLISAQMALRAGVIRKYAD
jgi:hypothetical protein